MSENNVPLLEPPKPLTFPQTNVNVGRDGLTITIVLAPGVALSTTVGEEAMNNIMRMWIETRKQLKMEMETMAAVMRSKGN